MIKYIFKLKDSYIPDLTRKTEKDPLYAGVRLSYIMWQVNYFKIFNQFHINYSIRKLGRVTFLRPYKKYWDKERLSQVPPAYWGKSKHPLMRTWVILNDAINPIGCLKISPITTLLHYKVKIFNRPFESKHIAAYLYSRNAKFCINQQFFKLNQSWEKTKKKQ